MPESNPRLLLPNLFNSYDYAYLERDMPQYGQASSTIGDMPFLLMFSPIWLYYWLIAEKFVVEF